MYNPYQFGGYNNVLPQQQVIQVNGKASVDTIQLAPNSSVLVMDTSAPLVWLCVSDGVGRVSSTAYDINLHKDQPVPDATSLEQRIAAIEATLTEMKERDNAKSNVGRTKPKQNNADNADA